MIKTALVQAWMKRYAEIIADKADYLTELDSPIGDADHGANMHRGMSAAVPAIEDESTIDGMLKKVGMTILSKVGGTSGPLYGTLFMKTAAALDGDTEVSPSQFVAALREGLNSLVLRGKTDLGDKTMVDAISPAVNELRDQLEAGAEFPDAVRAAAKAADEGREATTDMVAKKGRASYVGERSVGHTDPGATSSAYLFQALAEVV